MTLNPESSDLVSELERRGLVHQTTAPELKGLLAAEPITAYIGFDPTAASLHVGSLLQITLLMRLQRAGHRPIGLVGGGTGLIGDPSGKQNERPMLTSEKLEENLAGIRAQLERFLDFSGPRGAVVVNNADWLCKLNLVDFLRDVGKHFSVNAMVARDSVKNRLESREQGISYTEFSYSLLQAYDFLELFDRFGCRLQMGGSDQWANIVAGTDLIRRLRGATAFGLTSPLVIRADGAKFGKSEQGNVWLAPELTSPFEFFQYWLNTQDADALRYLGYFTFLPFERLAALEAAMAAAPQEREAQKVLAAAVTKMVHGEEALARSLHITQLLFGGEVLFEGRELSELSAQEMEEAFRHFEATELPRAALGTQEAALPAVLAASGLVPSKGQARTAITGGGVYVNNRRIAEPSYVIGDGDLLNGRFVVLRRGKKAYHVIRVV